MTTPPHPQREQPSTYFVQDRSSEEELTRVAIQDRMLTTSMGGVLPEQSDAMNFQSVLDVGCGTGGWLIETAKTYPGIAQLVGVDISSRMITYAATQAEAQQVNDRVQFHTMDVLRMLEFPDASFDLVNMRLGLSYLRTRDWPKLLQEFQRVSRRGAIIRVTEANMVETSSPALQRREQILLQAFYQAGHFFESEHDGVTKELVPLLQRFGLQNVQSHLHTLNYRSGTPEGQQFAENMLHGSRTLLPFMRKWTRVPEDYETLYQKLMIEMQQPDFTATWKLLTAWGSSR